MMRRILYPKHSLLSVANEIENGLESKSVYLSDEDLIEAGYEIHEFDKRWHSLEIPITGILYITVFILAIMVKLVEALSDVPIYCSLFGYCDVLDDHIYIILNVVLVYYSLAWVSLFFGFLLRKRRFVTKISTGERPYSGDQPASIHQSKSQ